MVYLFQLKITVVEMPILFEFLHILLESVCVIHPLMTSTLDFQTCSTVFLLLSLAHQHLVSGLLHSPSVPFLNSTLRTHHFHSSNLIPKTGQRQIHSREATGMRKWLSLSENLTLHGQAVLMSDEEKLN